MKSNLRKFIAAVSILLLSAAFMTLSAQNKKKDDIKEITFITSIDCPNCAKKVQENLPFEKGIKDLKVVLEERTVWIRYSARKTTREKLAAAIEKLGYQVLGVKETAKKK